MTEETISQEHIPTFKVSVASTETPILTSISPYDQAILEDLKELKNVYEETKDTEKRADYVIPTTDDENIKELYNADIRGIMSFCGKVSERTALELIHLLHNSLNPAMNKFEEKISTQWQAQCKLVRNKITIELTKWD